MPPGETLFVTYRLHSTIPAHLLLELQSEHEAFLARQIAGSLKTLETIEKRRWAARYFMTVDTLLDMAEEGPTWLSDNNVADIITESIHFRNGRQFDLHAYCVMSNHVHLLITVISSDIPFYRILGSLKANSAKKANQYLGRIGQPFWQQESYDHIVKNGKSFERILNYILNNPVKAGLVNNWQEWPHSYCKYDL